MYRADLSRTLTLVVALLLTVAPTSVFARELRAADTRREADPTIQAPRFMDRLVAEGRGGRLQIRVCHSRELGAEKQPFEQTRAHAIDFNRTNAEAAGATAVKDFDRKPFEEAMATLHGRAKSDPASAQLIARIRKVE